MNNSQEVKRNVRREYSRPQLTRWGTVADLTLVGQTRPGGDVLPGQAQGRQGGSVNRPRRRRWW
ncbi:lasso RiPP family leader peptide-containing protein [Halomonas sp. A29]|uniref:lasso RiPP family leader peptide-containing protein n=1 Tax=Halomonas sp. A29 TaxID=3102786 RepID=UPI00398A688F